MRIWSNIVITYWIIWKEELKHLFTVYYWWLCVWYFKLVRTDPIGTVYIVNKSNETIFVGASQLLEAGDSLSLKNLSMEYFLTGKTESGDTTYVQSNLDGLKTYNSTFQIIILKSSTLNTHTGKELKEKMIVDKRYCFTYDDLAENDQTIIYTGD